MTVLVGFAVALGLGAYHPAHSDVWLAVLSFFTSALAVAAVLAARGAAPALAPGKAPHQLPVRLQQFRGRESDLEALTKDYYRKRGALRRSWREQRTGPAILLIEGMPGVGKTTLAQALAHRITAAGDFPDGQLYANLGFAGGRRPPADVLHDFLTALGVPDRKIPMDTAERAKLFRSLTAARRLLVLLDAARGNDQIRDLLPTGERCTVIITRRSSIGPVLGAVGYRLDPLDTTSSLEILAAFSRNDPIEAAADAAEIVDHAGGLPLALRSAGEQIADGQFTMRTLARKLAEPNDRLDAFRYRARDIRERIESEYKKLMPEEQRALQLLSVVESPTFGPWVLAPMMGIGEIEAEKLVTRLATYNLIRPMSRENDTGLARYRLHPLVSLVARNEFQAAGSPEAQQQAKRRLYRAYLGAASAVLRLAAPEAATGPWTRFEPKWLPQVRERLDHWVRAEYCTLLGTIRFAYREEAWSLCWRIAARLGACVTAELPPDESIAAFDDALAAADMARSQLGRIEVLLARGSFLIAVERYEEAFNNLREALEATDTALDDVGPLQARRLWASAHRRKAEGWMQLGAYASAARELEIARAAAKGLDDNGATPGEVGRISLLTHENDTWRLPASWLDRQEFEQAYASSPDDGIKFRAILDLADQAQRRREWPEALDYLRQAYFQNYGDDRRIANVQYRTARLFLNQSRDRPRDERRSLGRVAVGYASDAVRIHRKMDNQVGVVRAEALLTSALRLADHQPAAAELTVRLKDQLCRFSGADPARPALQARVLRRDGEVLMDESDYEQACGILLGAARLFFGEADWHSAAEVLMTVAIARIADGQWEPAMNALNRASAICTERCQDETLKEEVERETERIRRTLLGLASFPV
jgi:tetratricopeptide (TPR) repeat protein